LAYAKSAWKAAQEGVTEMTDSPTQAGRKLKQGIPFRSIASWRGWHATAVKAVAKFVLSLTCAFSPKVRKDDRLAGRSCPWLTVFSLPAARLVAFSMIQPQAL